MGLVIGEDSWGDTRTVRIANSTVTVIACCANCNALLCSVICEACQASFKALVSGVLSEGQRVSNTLRMAFPVVINVGKLAFRAIKKAFSGIWVSEVGIRARRTSVLALICYIVSEFALRALLHA